MATRARIAQISDAQSIMQSGRPKRAPRPARSVLARFALLLLIGALVYASAQLLGPGSFQDQARGAAALFVRIAEWVRIVLASGFQRIPVW